VNPARIATVASNVTILGHVNRESAKRLYSTADVFVLPTLSDGFAITQLEAMAHGLPVIATNRCGEVVTDSQDGFIVPVRDAVALAGAISRIDDDRGLLSAMSERALRTAQRFTVQRYVRELESAVRAVPA
jgi:glycosyltransferase involved in cell wall biosynthesis